MSDENSEQDRSEQATPFKLRRAREKGSVARGLDLGFLSGLAAFAGLAWFTGRGALHDIGRLAQDGLVMASQPLLGGDRLLEVVGFLFLGVARPLAVLAATVFAVVLVMELVQTGFVFSSQPLKPDFSRLNPAKGLKRLFTVRILIETAKNVLKMAVYVGVAVLVIRHVLEAVAPTLQDGRSVAEAMRAVTLRLLSLALGAALLFALLDQLVTRREFGKKMRMSRREVRREHRDREGDSRLKQKRRQLHGEFVKVSQSLRGVRGADVLITNPTHYAVALRYEPARMAAPTIVSQGSNQLARRLKRLAVFYGVTVVENPPLAQALFRLPLHSETPEALFHPIADVYRALRAKTSPRGAAHV